MKLKSAWSIFKSTLTQFGQDRVTRLSAALAYYAIFSIGPLLVLIVGVTGIILGEQAVRQEVQVQIAKVMGPSAASTIQSMMAAQHQGGSLVTTIISAVALVLGASGIFGQLQDSLNTIWEVQPKPGMSIWAYIRDRFFSMSMVLGVAILLFISMVLTGFVTTLSRKVTGVIPVPPWVLLAANAVVTIVIITFLFGLIFKYLPDVRIRWRDVRMGALSTAALFVIGNYLLGWYLARASTVSSYGAAGSVVVLLLYVYYSSLIFFFGAELTKAYAQHTGSKIEPAKYAVRVTEEQRAHEGRPTQEQVEQAARKQQKQGGDSQLPKAA